MSDPVRKGEIVMSVPLAPARLSLGYKVTWGIAALGTSLISGIYGALLPIFFTS